MATFSATEIADMLVYGNENVAIKAQLDKPRGSRKNPVLTLARKKNILL